MLYGKDLLVRILASIRRGGVQGLPSLPYYISRAMICSLHDYLCERRVVIPQGRAEIGLRQNAHLDRNARREDLSQPKFGFQIVRCNHNVCLAEAPN